MSCATHMSVSCSTYELVMIALCHRYERIVLQMQIEHVWMSLVTHIDESRHTNLGGTATHCNTLRHTTTRWYTLVLKSLFLHLSLSPSNIRTYWYIYIYTHVHEYIHAYVHIYNTCECINIHLHLYVSMFPCIHMYTNTYIHEQTYIYTTNICIYTYKPDSAIQWCEVFMKTF